MVSKRQSEGSAFFFVLLLKPSHGASSEKFLEDTGIKSVFLNQQNSGIGSFLTAYE